MKKRGIQQSGCYDRQAHKEALFFPNSRPEKNNSYQVSDTNHLPSTSTDRTPIYDNYNSQQNQYHKQMSHSALNNYEHNDQRSGYSHAQEDINILLDKFLETPRGITVNINFK